MESRKEKPAMPFYIGNWFKAPEIRAMSLQSRMIWFEILCLMWQSDEPGYLTINKRAFVITNDITGVIIKGENMLASMLGIDVKVLQNTFIEFFDLGVYSKRENDGAIFSRFMTKLISIQEKRANAGKAGMESRYKKKVSYNKRDKSVITKHITNTESEYEIEIENKDAIIIELPLIVETIYDKIINHYNLKTGQKLKSSTKSTKKDIDILLKQKFTFENFVTVIDKKYAEWINDIEMCQYIRPSTLFGKKFEIYLEQPIIQKIKQYESKPTISEEPKPFKL